MKTLIPRPSLAGRAILAVALTVGFYSLALAIAGALLFFIYAQFAYAERFNLQLTIFCLIGAGTILWAILPRFDRFTIIGLRLDAHEHPRLFSEISAIAAKTGQKMPAEVYLALDMNAFVAERGGLLGIGVRRVMGIGLPLMQVLSVAQLRSILAHEFGHYYGGDTHLGPWIYKTRSAIGRAIQGLSRSWLQYPFRWYGLLFLRITQSISRRQEYVADELAARLEGANTVADAMRLIHAQASAFDAYLQNEVGPVVRSGFQPHLAQGFSLFLGVPEIQDVMQKLLQEQIETAETDPYDSHPSLKDRLAALSALPAGNESGDNRSALTLLQDLPEMEKRLFQAFKPEDQKEELRPVEWEEVGMAVYLPFWLKTVQAYSQGLQGVTPAMLPEFAPAPQRLVQRLLQLEKEKSSEEDLNKAARSIIAIALVVALAHHGWRIEALPGTNFVVRKDGQVFTPFVDISALAAGTLSKEEWLQRCDQAGIASLDLGA